jgi:hypothetical protein
MKVDVMVLITARMWFPPRIKKVLRSSLQKIHVNTTARSADDLPRPYFQWLQQYSIHTRPVSKPWIHQFHEFEMCTTTYNQIHLKICCWKMIVDKRIPQQILFEVADKDHNINFLTGPALFNIVPQVKIRESHWPKHITCPCNIF